MAQELRLLARRWGFDVTSVQAPLQLWHGTADDVVPMWLAEWVAGALPHAETRYIEDAGHLLMLDHMTEIVELLLESRAAGPVVGVAAAAG
ncbi:MAG: alpha/beta hydrolase [Chloroflexi bacterium]|nr:alpha/beta hydrolase [Chloroflexota bacterium]